MPPRHRRRKSIPAPFLFVNEDASTVTGTGNDAQRNRAKQSHVQRRGFAERTKTERSHESALSGHSQAGGFKPEGSGQPSVPLTLQQRQSAYSHPVSVPRSEPSSSVLPVQHQTEPNTVIGPISAGPHHSINHYHFYQQAAPAPLPTSQIIALHDVNTALNNPLRSSTVHPLLNDRYQLLQKWTPTLMSYWTTTLLPEKFYPDSRIVPVAQMRHAQYFHNELQLSLTKPAHAYAFLANISVQMLRKEGRLLIPSSHSPADLYSSSTSSPHESHVADARIPELFKAHAISAIRNELSANPLSHDTAQDVLHLLATAYHQNNMEAARPHYQALLRMINTLGGLGTFSAYFAETMFLLHWSANLKGLSRPTLPVKSFDPGEGPDDVCAVVSQLRNASPLTSGFSRLAQHSFMVSPQLLQLAQSLADVILFARYAELQPLYVPAHFRWIDTRHIAVGYHLLSLPPDVMYGKINEAIRIAMIFSTALTRSPRSGQSCASMSVGLSRLRDLIVGSDGTTRLWSNIDGGTQALLWISVVGGLTSGWKNPDSRKWFRSLAQQCGEKLCIDKIDSEHSATQAMNDFGQGFELQHTGELTFTANTSTTYLETPLDQGDPSQIAVTTSSDQPYDYTTAVPIPERATDDSDRSEAPEGGPEHRIDIVGEVNAEDEQATWEADTFTSPGGLVPVAATKAPGRQVKEEWQCVQDILLRFIWDEALEGGPLQTFWSEMPEHGALVF
ncbi:uncharacterized protein AB675_7633 [Cyphellophora attinorum]|uniref:Uncharacterized protein n=1 Tax=Cyphellophora attinorum TaxID=1664694 RepID=A0A0N1P0J0_9EURO|nr:uncharacterized protein AB675_7633 [Phialophora attinorum]KPI40430.1 hypothetical protein AB675_7633 [Phialophora attinorum]